MAVVSDVEIRLRADIARLRQDLSDARREVTGALNSMSASAEAFKGLLGGIAAGLSVGAFVGFIKQSIDAADALNDMSARTKVAIEDLAGLAYAAKLGDTSLEGVAGAISKLGMNIGKDGAKFRQLGITATEPLEAFKQLADVFKNIQDPQQRAAFGAEALGKSWQEAAVLLDGGSEGIATLIARGQELSGITKDITDDAGKFNDKLDELGFAAQGVGTRIAAGLLPTLQKIADSFSANAVNGKELEGVITVLSGTLKGLYSVGVGISALFVGLGKSIGGTAAIAVAALSGDFAGALATYKTMAADVYSGFGDAAVQIAKVWVDTGKAATGAADAGDEMADRLIASATAVKVATFLNSSEIAGARDKAAAAAEAARKKEQGAYAGLIASIKEKIAADQLEVAGGAALTDSQKTRIKIDEELAAGKIVLTAEHIKEIHAQLDLAAAMEKNVAAAKQVRAAVKTLADERDKNYENLVSEAAANEELVKTYGKTKLQIMQMTQARDLDRLSQRGALELSEDTVAQLEREIEARKRSIAAMGTLDVLDKQKKASDDAAASQVAFWKSIDDTAHATFVSIANGSKDTAQRLKDTFKNVFFDWLYQQTIKKWIINVGTETSSTGSAVSSIASLFGSSSGGSSGGAGGILGTASNWLSIGKTIYSGFTGGLVSSLGSSITSLGTTLGSEAVAAFGAGIQGGALGASTASAASGYAGTTAAGFGASAASAIPIIGWIIAGMQAADSFRKQGFTANNGTITNPILQAAALPTNFAEKTMKAIGFNDAIANILSGAAINTKLFGRADPRVEAQGLRGTVSAAGFDADSYAKIIEKGGIFRSSKRYEKSADLDAATDKAWDETIANMITSVKGFGKAMGLETAAIDTYSKVFDIKLTGKAEEDNATVAKLFADVGDEMSLRLIPGLAGFAKEGEALSTTLQRLATDYLNVDDILRAVGQSIKLFGVAGIEARENLIAAAGGLDKLSPGVGYFMQNFLSSAEQLAPVQKQVADALASMGMSAVKTNDQFKAAVLGIDLNTKAGAELYVQMLALAPAFKEVTDATEAAAKAAADAAKAAADAAIATAKAQADAAIATANSAFDALSKAIAARKSEMQSQFDGVLAGLTSGIGAVTSAANNLRSVVGVVDGAVGDLLGTAAETARKKLAEFARSGATPQSNELQGLASAASRFEENQFATALDARRAQLLVANSLETISGTAESNYAGTMALLATLQMQNSVTEAAAMAEQKRLDGLLLAAQSQIDAVNGVAVSVLSLSQAISGFASAIGGVSAMSGPVGTPSTTWNSTANTGFVQQGQSTFFDSEAALAHLETIAASSASSATAQQTTAARMTQLATQFDNVSAGGNALLTESSGVTKVSTV